MKNKSKLMIVTICISFIAILSISCYTLFNMKDQKEISNPKEIEGLAVLVDGEKTDTFPTKDSGKVFDKIECTNGGVAEWNADTWRLAVRHINHSTECTVSFMTLKVPTAVEKITELAKTNTTEMFIDDTVDANIRFMGADPANYVDIGNGPYGEDVYRGYYSDIDTSYEEYSTLDACQVGKQPVFSGGSRYNTNCTKIYSKGDPILWRIIGVMNNINDGTGKKETRIKLIREKFLEKLAWDNKCTGTYDETYGSCTMTSFTTNWKRASISKTINEAFYNSTKTTDPNYNGLIWQKLDFSAIGLRSVNENFVGDVVYHLGGPTENNYQTLTALGYYNVEKSEISASGNPTTWTGKVGLMYPSDYGYATSGGVNKSKESCAIKALSNWNENNYEDCKNNDWLLDSGQSQWTMTPYASNNAKRATDVCRTGNVFTNYNYTSDAYTVRPVVYLKSDVKITGGNGTKENPYTLGI